ncbi:MAG: hypothetical protein HC883_00040 [Bdellovibrionaceae bacterium]|nr:hypothetical protein [Pseudobdellovibrionaceae bacterium]
MAKKTAKLKSKCVCGHELKVSIEKPTRFNPTIAKVSCLCDSRYMFSCMIDKQSGAPRLQVDILRLSTIAKDIARARTCATAAAAAGWSKRVF